MKDGDLLDVKSREFKMELKAGTFSFGGGATAAPAPAAASKGTSSFGIPAPAPFGGFGATAVPAAKDPSTSCLAKDPSTGAYLLPTTKVYLGKHRCGSPVVSFSEFSLSFTPDKGCAPPGADPSSTMIKLSFATMTTVELNPRLGVICIWGDPTNTLGQSLCPYSTPIRAADGSKVYDKVASKGGLRLPCPAP